MKRIAYLLVAGSLALTACNNEPAYKISGIIENVADGETVYLQEVQGRDLMKLDSAVVKNGTFNFTGRQDSTINCYITYTTDEIRMMTELFLENGNINVALSEESRVTGTPNNDIYQVFKDQFIALNKEMNEIYQKARTDSTLTDEQRAEIMKQIEEKDAAAMEMVYNTITTNITNPVGLYLLPSYAPAFEFEKQVALAEQIPAQYQNNERISRFINSIEVAKKTAVGQKYIDFTMNDPKGKEVKLSDFIGKNKYTLVDFWASWCGPCKKEMPNVIAAYKEYNKKGFGIVGVSLDNDGDKWKEAIKTWGMPWPQMSDLKGWNCEGAAIYGVRSIPATVLIDQEGNIIARNLRGDAIKEKLSELLK
jgi:peroxiredoxin